MPLLSLSDLLETQSTLLQKEDDDRQVLEALASLSVDILRDTLLQWIGLKMPANWTFYELTLVPPAKCSDGVVRGLAEYIHFCGGREFPEYIAELQEKVDGVVFGYQWIGSTIRIVVSKADTP